MSTHLSRRSALGMGAAAAATAVGIGSPARAEAAAGPARTGPAAIKATYEKEKAKAKAAAGGDWLTHIAALDPSGNIVPIVEDDADRAIEGYSVMKLAVATAVLHRIDAKEIIPIDREGVVTEEQLTLGTKLNLPGGDFILDAGSYWLQRPYFGDQLTVANILTALLLVSDNTAVRMCGRIAPAAKINEILAAKGFTSTRVTPVADPNRFFLGKTTAREMHDLLWRLGNQTLLSPESCRFLLKILRAPEGYHDGVRRVMSSNERNRVATKYGAYEDPDEWGRNEAGIMFGNDGRPKLTYAMFTSKLTGARGNMGSTHPVVQAHAVLGRTMIENLPTGAAPATAQRSREAAPTVDLTPVTPSNGG